MWRRVADKVRSPWYWTYVIHLIHARACRKHPKAPSARLGVWAEELVKEERERFELRLSKSIMV